jgi:hypothetical protein
MSVAARTNAERGPRGVEPGVAKRQKRASKLDSKLKLEALGVPALTASMRKSLR